MTLLLDSHVFLWWLVESPELSEDLIDAVSAAAEVYVSAASVYEIGIKRANGKLDAPEDLPNVVREAGFVELPIRSRHAAAAAALPPLHADPFDRLLVAQARAELLTLVTRDRNIHRYDVPILPA